MPFLIPIEIKQSNIKGAGLGIFTKEAIKKDTKIWSYSTDHVLELTTEQLESMYNSETNKFNYFMTEYMYFNHGSNKAIIDLDNMKFMNHSDEPNIYNYGLYSSSLYDIEAGSELYENYNSYGDMPEIMVKLHDKYKIWLPDGEKEQKEEPVKDKSNINQNSPVQKFIRYISSIF